MIKEDNKRVVSYISDKVYEKLVKEADYEGRSISNMIAKIINEHYSVNDDE